MPITQDNSVCPPDSPMIPVAKNNTIILEVDNLLINWPTYVINFTPDEPGPIIKILLRLKDTNLTKRAIKDDGIICNSDSDNENIFAKVVMKPRPRGFPLLLISFGCSLFWSQNSNEDIIMNEKTLMADATPVVLQGLERSDAVVYPKLFNVKPWPSLHHRGLRPVSSNEPLSLFDVLKTTPADVNIIKVHQKVY
ncbi:hypothetical protein JVT61DRAFT_11456 [Boletus reticuloceps]|uniref:Uncharacterized protein n=1 Tax=Boletus reticuloceps TaxID=495285 RepID=A0A8I2YUW6_9AGAM|nr:hypothetical protein JVT61DRAFT_11456 [Boletus reticuloceps]